MGAGYAGAKAREAHAMKTKGWAAGERSWGDAAVDGLLSGAGAGVLMAIYLLVAGLLGGQSWQAILAQFDPGANPQPLTGALAHLAVAAVYGAVFGVGRRFWPAGWPKLPTWLAGALYGLALWVIALGVTRGRPDGVWLAGSGPVHLGVAHAVYGVALGALLRRWHV
jgi:hypothetical protein